MITTGTPLATSLRHEDQPSAQRADLTKMLVSIGFHSEKQTFRRSEKYCADDTFLMSVTLLRIVEIR